MKRGLLLSLVLLMASMSAWATTCTGRFMNPISDVAWLSIFPISIGPASVTMGQDPDGGSGAAPVCICPGPPPLFTKWGIAWSFWEPARVAEVVRKPYCSPSFNGTALASLKAPPGAHRDDRSHYQVHWLEYPLLMITGMFTDNLCESGSGSGGLDMLYMTELDAMWQDDELSFLVNPEAALFASLPLQAACVADCLAASVGFPLDPLFWCAGCNGAIYPMAGTSSDHIGGVQTSLLMTQRMVAKLHRQFIAQDTSSQSTICSDQPAPILPKRQYKTQIVFPRPLTGMSHPLGRTSSVWATGQEYPVQGENWAHLVWRKYLCCSTY